MLSVDAKHDEYKNTKQDEIKTLVSKALFFGFAFTFKILLFCIKCKCFLHLRF